MKNKFPQYIIDNHDKNSLINTNYQLPGYVMLKFRDKNSNIDEAYNILKILLNSKEWNVTTFYTDII